jgi:hypothetical protein
MSDLARPMSDLAQPMLRALSARPMPVWEPPILGRGQ